jgi:hypothetical protein
MNIFKKKRRSKTFGVKAAALPFRVSTPGVASRDFAQSVGPWGKGTEGDFLFLSKRCSRTRTRKIPVIRLLATKIWRDPGRASKRV